jgi:hypothetical protein
MGALDDAIREHLELKRRHGASDEELTQAEAEALGPARREPGAEPLDAVGDPMPPPDPAEGASAGEHYEADAHPPGDDYLITDPPPPPAPPVAGPEREPSPVAEPDAPPVEPHPVEPHAAPPADPDRQRTAILDDPLRDMPPRDEAPIHHEPGPGEPPAPARPPEATAPAGPDEDVLEETPDFLQETPEHDRLWFEQKPPRDFDFDD